MTDERSDEPELSFGQMAVGLNFNPSGDDEVTLAKTWCAAVIDQMYRITDDPEASPMKVRLAEDAISAMIGAQMWAVKAITWRG